jgi:hypothetical protein
MKCKICGQEAKILSAFDICADCEKSVLNKLTADPGSTVEQETKSQTGVAKTGNPVSKKGEWANLLALLSAGLLVFDMTIISLYSELIIASHNSILILAFLAMVMIPSISSIILSVTAKLEDHDKSRITTRAMIIGIVMTLLAIPVLALVLLYFSLSQMHFDF